MSTILLADDSLTIQKVVELTFGETEHDVIAVPDGAELLRRLPEVRPDVVICDVIMPGMEGYEVCQQIKSDPSTLHIPVILLTGTFEPFDRDRALAAGCSEIITKPFEARRLVETVERLLETGVEAEPDDLAAEPGAVVPPPLLEPEPTPEEFRTHLAEPEAEEALEYTSSGFAEMQESGAAAESWSAELPEEGLEFEIGDDTASRMENADTGEIDTDDQPFPEPPPLEPEDVAGFSDPDTQDAPFTDYEVAAADVQDEWRRTDSDAPADGDAGDDPFDAMPLEPLEPTGPEFEDRPDDALALVEEAAPEPAADADAWGAADEPAATDRGPDTSPMETEVAAHHDEPAMAPVPAPEAATPTTAPHAGGGLSDEDVERIARRVAEIAAERIEQIAWEVIPDMAEIVVRERVRELEAEIEGTSPGAVQ